MAKAAKEGRIRVGIGGWTYPPWRATFYPKGLPHARELEYASRQVTAIEINGTFYRTQKPESFAKWRDETPDDFVFSVKAPRYATIRRVLGDAGSSIEHFVDESWAEYVRRNVAFDLRYTALEYVVASGGEGSVGASSIGAGVSFFFGGSSRSP